MDLHNREEGAPPSPTHPSLPCTVSEISDIASLINVTKTLLTLVSDIIRNRKSVTKPNKELIDAAAVEAKHAVEMLPLIIEAEHGPKAADLKTEIISAVRQELASFKRQSNTAATTNQQQQGLQPLSYAQAARTASRQPPPPRTTPPVSKPALIIASKKEGSSSADTLSSWRSSVTFKDTNFTPAGVQFVSNNKLRVEFDSEAHLQATLEKIDESNPYISVEVSKKLKPMFIVKGVNSDISTDELKSVIINQNDSIQNSIKDPNDLIFKFKRPNKNEKLYNAVFMTAPYLWRTILKSQKLNVDHQRVYFEEFTPLLQCYKCLSYGHTRKLCKNNDTYCSHCSKSGHEFKDCPVKKDLSKVTCHNCKTLSEKSKGSSDINHSATSDSCPRRQYMIDRTRSRVDYGS